MEDLLNKQKTEIDELNRLIKNYNADGPTRKTEKYLRDKILTFPEAFRVIQENHDHINELRETAHDDQPYFKENTFEKLKEKYEKTMANIHERLTTLTNPKQQPPAILSLSGSKSTVANNTPRDNDDDINDDTGNGTGNGTGNCIGSSDGIGDDHDNDGRSSEDMGTDLLTLLYEELMDAVASTWGLNEESSIGTVTAQLTNLNSIWSEFRATFYKEKSMGKNPAISYTLLSQKYMCATGKLNDLIQENKKNNEPSLGNRFNLPVIKLHEFHGKISEWKPFIAKFDRLVHNKNIDDGTKMEYLKMVIRGDAAKLINHIDPTPQNYKICYDILKKRYENNREILNSLIDRLLKFPRMKSESANELKALHDSTYECIMSIQSIGISIQNWDPLLTHILCGKLDQATIIHYECQLGDVREPQSLPSLLDYMENRFMALQSAALKASTFTNNNHSNGAHNSFKYGENRFQQRNNSSKCVFCPESGDSHNIYSCKLFQKKAPNERLDWTKSKKLCVKCFGNHKAFDCTSKITCRECSGHHNALLHLQRKNHEKSIKANVARATEPNINKDTEEVVNINSNVAHRSTASVVLATVLLGVFDKNGAKILVRALLDQGSQSAFISESMAQILKTERKDINAIISGIGEKEQSAKHSMQLTLFPRFKSDYVLNCEAIVLPRLTNVSKNTHLKPDFEFVNNLTLADPSFLDSGEIDIILGASEYAQIIKMGLIKGERNIIAQNSEFG